MSKQELPIIDAGGDVPGAAAARRWRALSESEAVELASPALAGTA